jgi:hypothetical protein
MCYVRVDLGESRECDDPAVWERWKALLNSRLGREGNKRGGNKSKRERENKQKASQHSPEVSPRIPSSIVLHNAKVRSGSDVTR